MTGKSGVATAVAAPTIVQRIGNGATLLGGGVAVLMRRCGGVAALMAMSDRLAFPFRLRPPLGCFLVRVSYTFVAVAVFLYF